ncbi:MAG: protein tyrosine phosphatase [Planctomycetota bacterium]|nr:MAG: protein tyrosine phosphatase [Planctomycetota bacterium]
MPNILFLCSKNQWRSPTAERIYQKDACCHVRSAGISSKAKRKVNAKDLAWADLVLVMEKHHRAQLQQRFPVEMREVEVQILDIPDDYPFMDSDLIQLCKDSIEPYL